MLCDFHHSIAKREVGAPSALRRASILDDLVIEALQPVSFLQVGMMWQLPGGDYGAVVVRSVRSLDHAIGALAQYEFDAIILGSALMDAWPTAAYEQIAKLAGATPVLVQTDFIGPMTDIKQQQDREQDIIVALLKAIRSRSFGVDGDTAESCARRRARHADRVSTAFQSSPPRHRSAAHRGMITAAPGRCFYGAVALADMGEDAQAWSVGPGRRIGLDGGEQSHAKQLASSLNRARLGGPALPLLLTPTTRASAQQAMKLMVELYHLIG
jgi:hypothetical protein